jgi:SPP1 gp7 family putative phage head morphogenesis protein
MFKCTRAGATRNKPCSCCPPVPITANAKRRPGLGLKLDPSRTLGISKRWTAEYRRRYGQLAVAIWQFVYKDDELGLAPRKPFVVNAGHYAFLTSSKKVSAFNEWLDEQIETNLLTTVGDGTPWAGKYVQGAYQKAAMRAFELVNKKDMNKPMDFIAGTRQQFLRSSFSGEVRTETLKNLYTRTFEEMKGLGAETKKKLGRILADGVAQGKNPYNIAKDMVRQIEKLSKVRAELIATTETIRAHAEGALDSFKALGVEMVDPEVELLTSGFNVCPVCLALASEGSRTIDEARGIIPVHPRCRCTWIPVIQIPKKTKKK